VGSKKDAPSRDNAYLWCTPLAYFHSTHCGFRHFGDRTVLAVKFSHKQCWKKMFLLALYQGPLFGPCVGCWQTVGLTLPSEHHAAR